MILESLKFLIKASYVKVIYQFFYLITVKFLLDESQGSLLLETVVPTIGYSFFAKSGFNALLIHKNKKQSKDSFVFASLVFLLTYPFYLLIINGNYDFFNLIITFLLYGILCKADYELIFGNERNYQILSNYYYGVLITYVLALIFLELKIFMIGIHFNLIILGISIFIYFYYKPRLDSKLLIIQAGGLLSTSLSTLHATFLTGNQLVNYFFGKAIGELPFNFFGYHLSNLIHKKKITFLNKKLEILFLVVCLIYSSYSIFGLLGVLNFSYYLSSAFSSSLLFLIILPLHILNTYVTRRFHAHDFIKLGTLIQIVNNVLALIFVYRVNTSSGLYFSYLFPMSFSSLIALLILIFYKK